MKEKLNGLATVGLKQIKDLESKLKEKMQQSDLQSLTVQLKVAKTYLAMLVFSSMGKWQVELNDILSLFSFSRLKSLRKS